MNDLHISKKNVEWLRLFERTGWAYEKLSCPQWKRYPTEDNYSDQRTAEARLNALLLFLEGYAFERAGCPPYFSGLAVDVLKGIGAWPPDEKSVWKRFKYALSRWKQDNPEVVQWPKSDDEIEDLQNNLNGLNPKVNPLAPEGTDYWEKGIWAGKTAQKSIIKLAHDPAHNLDMPLDLWVRDHLENETQKVYSELSGASGIADKIASLFMRDVACHYDVFPPDADARKLLQPIDIWERRTVQLLRDGKVAEDDDKHDDEYRAFIVDNSIKAGCSPERVNQGIWYFGSQIAGTEYFLYRALTLPDGIHLAKNWL